MSNGANPDVNGPPPSGFSLLNFFGFSRLLFTTAHEFLEKAKLNEPKYWDYNHQDYFLRECTVFYPLIKSTGIDELIAIGCGAGTAVIDEAQGILDQASSINNALEFIFVKEARDTAFNNLKQTIDDLRSPEMRQFIFAMLKKELLKEVKELKDNEYKLWYYGGYFPTQVIVGVLTGTAGAKLMNAFDAKTGYREKIKKVQDIARKYAPKAPNVGEILGKIFKSEKYDIIEDANGNTIIREVDALGNPVGTVATINQAGRLPTKPTQTAPTNYEHGGFIEVEGGGHAQVVKGSEMGVYTS